MITRRFGRTGLQMPVFSCGGMRFQQSWKDTGQEITAESQENLHATVSRALELGINHIETARGYGTSERQLGMLWDSIDRDRVILQTKVGPSSDPGLFEKNVLDSLDRLRTDHVDLFAIHGVNTWEKLWYTVRPGGCLEVARRLQQEGRVGHVGVSTHGSAELIATLIDSDLDYINLHWYFIFQRNWAAIEAATAADMGVFIISPSDKGGRLYEPSQRLMDLCNPLHPLVFNALFCLARPQVHTLSVGAAVPSDFDLAMTALDHNPTEAIREPQQRLLDAMAEIVGIEDWAGMSEGIPSWELCPGLINVEQVVMLRSVMQAWGMGEFARWRYQGLGRESDWLPGNNAEHGADFDFGHALRKSPLRDSIPGWLADAHQLLSGS